MNDDAGNEAASSLKRKRRQAPAIPEGWQIGPPDFVGIGAHKAGTTWWWALLTRHPEIDTVLRRKELHLLEHMRDGPISDEQREWYYRQFPRAPGHLAGEWTTRYMTMPPMPRIIKDVAPAAKILVLVRDPVERYRSGLTQWERQTRRGGRRRDEKAGKREALKRGFYGRQVQRFVDELGPASVLVQQYECCVRDPEAEYDRTVRFLGVSSHPPDTKLMRLRQNMTIGKKVKLSTGEIDELIATYEPEVRLIKQLVPDLDLSMWPHFSGLAAG